MVQIHGECGFGIYREDGETRLVNRRTWWLGYGMGTFGLLALITAVLAVLGLVGAPDVRADVSMSVLFGLAVAFAVIAGLMLPVYKRRRELPPTEVSGTAVMDHGGGVLRGSGHEVLAQLESVRVAVRIDWWTRGWMRLVVLTWPGGRRTVFRTWSRQRARIVAESLRDILGA
jgi:hypothetical protein